jgi:hypothetical protein
LPFLSVRDCCVLQLATLLAANILAKNITVFALLALQFAEFQIPLVYTVGGGSIKAFARRLLCFILS